MPAAAKQKRDRHFTKWKIGPDDQVTLDGRIFDFDGYFKNGVHLKAADDGPRQQRALKWSTLAAYKAQERLEIKYGIHTKRNALAIEERRTLVTDLGADVIMRAKMVAEFLEAEEGITDIGFSVARSRDKIILFQRYFEANNQALVEQVRAYLYKSDRKRKNPFVGPRQFQRLIEQFEDGQLDPASLEAAYQGRPSSEGKFTPEALAFAYVYLDKYLTEDQPSLQFAWEEMDRANEALPPDERHAELPSVTTMWRLKQEMGDLLNEGSRGHDKYRIEREYAISGKGLQPERPLQIVEMDCHRVNLMTILTKNHLWKFMHPEVRKKINKKTYRGWLSVALDAFSRSVVGMKFLFKAPDTESSIATLAMVAQDKTPLSALTGAKTRWEQSGTAERVHTDAGSEYVGAEFQAVVFMFTGKHTIPPASHPHLRARIERFFGTLNRRYAHLFPGQSFSSILLKDQYDSEKFARLTHDQVADLIVRLIVDCYHNTYHRGIGMTPLQKWYRGSQDAKGGVMAAPKADEYRAIFGTTLEYQVGNYGIVIAGNRYRNDDLLDLRKEWKNRKFVVRVNDQDLSAIAVKHPTSNDWLEVPATFDGLKGVTGSEWSMVLDMLHRKYGKKLNHRQPVIVQAIKEVKEFIAKTGESSNVILHTSPKDFFKALDEKYAALVGYTERQDYDDGVRDEEVADRKPVPEAEALDYTDGDDDVTSEDDDAFESPVADDEVYDTSTFLDPKERRSPPSFVGGPPPPTKAPPKQSKAAGTLPRASAKPDAPSARSRLADDATAPVSEPSVDKPKKKPQRFAPMHRNDS